MDAVLGRLDQRRFQRENAAVTYRVMDEFVASSLFVLEQERELAFLDEWDDAPELVLGGFRVAGDRRARSGHARS